MPSKCVAKSFTYKLLYEIPQLTLERDTVFISQDWGPGTQRGKMSSSKVILGRCGRAGMWTQTSEFSVASSLGFLPIECIVFFWTWLNSNFWHHGYKCKGFPIGLQHFWEWRMILYSIPLSRDGGQVVSLNILVITQEVGHVSIHRIALSKISKYDNCDVWIQSFFLSNYVEYFVPLLKPLQRQIQNWERKKKLSSILLYC